jgi:hypothetical protein
MKTKIVETVENFELTTENSAQILLFINTSLDTKLVKVA